MFNLAYSRHPVFCVVVPFRAILTVLHVKTPRIVAIHTSLDSNGRQPFTCWTQINLNEWRPVVYVDVPRDVTQPRTDIWTPWRRRCFDLTVRDLLTVLILHPQGSRAYWEKIHLSCKKKDNLPWRKQRHNIQKYIKIAMTCKGHKIVNKTNGCHKIKMYSFKQ